MLFHVSIAADDPESAARMIAELWRGRAYPFPPVAEGSWVAMAGDDRNSTVEVYPRGTELREGSEESLIVRGNGGRYGPSHAAIASPLSVEEVTDIAARYGTSAKVCNRGPFHVIELWVEGCFLFEVLTPEFQLEYLEGVTIERWEAMLAARPPGAPAPRPAVAIA
jgi:hypothetical protein